MPDLTPRDKLNLLVGRIGGLYDNYLHTISSIYLNDAITPSGLLANTDLVDDLTDILKKHRDAAAKMLEGD